MASELRRPLPSTNSDPAQRSEFDRRRDAGQSLRLFANAALSAVHADDHPAKGRRIDY